MEMPDVGLICTLFLFTGEYRERIADNTVKIIDRYTRARPPRWRRARLLKLK